MSKQVATLPPVLETERLSLTPYRPEDFADVVRIVTDPQVIWWRNEPYSEAEVRTFFERTLEEQKSGLGWWLVRDRSYKLQGQAALKPLAAKPGAIEVGYHFLVEGRGQGYATEASRALLRYGFEVLGLLEITAIVLPVNEKSQAVMRRLKMPRTGILKHGGLPHDFFSMTGEQWRARCAP